MSKIILAIQKVCHENNYFLPISSSTCLDQSLLMDTVQLPGSSVLPWLRVDTRTREMTRPRLTNMINLRKKATFCRHRITLEKPVIGRV